MTKVALVHEWFTQLAGSEKVVEQICRLYSDLDLFAVYADPELVASTDFLQERCIRTSFVQRLPNAAERFRSYLMLMPLAVEQFDLSGYDVVLSSNHAVAKGVITGPNQLHISYVHTPLRYAWDLQHQYLREAGLTDGLKGWVAKWMLHKMRIRDCRTASGVDHFVANSQFIARRIQKVYGREADVIYPPVDVAGFSLCTQHDDYYLAAARLVPYKRMDLIVDAFAAMPDRKLVVVGEGPESAKIKEKCKGKSNIELLEHQEPDTFRGLMQRARAFVFAAEEDFGITVVEAQACGTPVIALGRGGALETIVGLGTSPTPTGVFFQDQEAEQIVAAVELFEKNDSAFDPTYCRDNAMRFSNERFAAEFSAYVERCLALRDGNPRSRTSSTELPTLAGPWNPQSTSSSDWLLAE
jgi:glycosyltransferase involved in cell wall biosynthesis